MKTKNKIFILIAAAATLLSALLLYKNSTHIDQKKIFNEIYLKAHWGRDTQGRGHSGRGSTPAVTKRYVAFLNNFIKKHNIKSVVDAGCGDWQFSQHIEWGSANYLGVDISNIVINRTAKKHSRSGIKFIQGDITEKLPSADLLICKDVLQHLSNRLILKFIKNNLIKGKYKWALITNDKLITGENTDIKTGGYHRLDLSKPPFNIKGLTDAPNPFDEFENGKRTTKTLQILTLSK